MNFPTTQFRKSVVAVLAILIAQTGVFTATANAESDIVDTAVNAGSFSTLVAAVKAGGLVETLKGDGPFTVFAPTDAAFAKLPAGTVEDLLKPENKAKLVDILKYHVVAGKVPASKVVGLTSADTVQGTKVSVSAKDGAVKVGGANVVKTDIACSNGIIHVIDAVLLPSSPDIVDTAVAAGDFKTLVAAVKAAGLVDTLKGDGPFTVFAPTDAAFAKLPKGTVESLLKPENKQKLVGILTYHVVPGKVLAADVVKLKKATTVQGSDVAVEVKDGAVMLDAAKVIKTDIETSNGVIHVIDSVILPADENAKKAAGMQRAGAAPLAASSPSPQEMLEFSTQPDIVDTAVGAGSFNTLVAAVKAAGLVDTLKGPGPFTVFAPTDDAFAKLPAGTVESLLLPENRDKLVKILTYHVVPGKVLAADVVKLSSAPTVQGASVAIAVVNGGVKIDNANVVKTDIETSNGVIHVIDSVIMPGGNQSHAAAKSVLEEAIRHGVPAYNSGDHCRCAQLYTYAMMDLMIKHKDSLPKPVQDDIMGTLDEARHTHSAGPRAWVLRRGMDRAYMAMSN